MVVIRNTNWKESVKGEIKKFNCWGVFWEKRNFDLIPIIIFPRRKGYRNGKK